MTFNPADPFAAFRAYNVWIDAEGIHLIAADLLTEASA